VSAADDTSDAGAPNAPGDARVVVALDVGGTAMKGGVCDRAAAVVHRERRRTAEGGTAAVVDGIVALADALAGEARRRFGPAAVAGIGLAVPGLVDEARGVALRAVNLPWRDLAIADVVAERTGLPVVLSHDVRAAAAAEAALGAGRGAGDFVFVAIGTGIGAAIVSGGRPLGGAHGLAGELGHTVVEPGGPLCACGGEGHLEAIASAAAIERAYAEAGAGDGASAREVAALAEAHDPAARAVWARAVAALGAALADAVALLDPALIVVGGGLAEAGEALLDPLAAEVAARVPLGAPPPVVAAALGADAGCRGAALLACRGLADGAAGAPEAGARPAALRAPRPA
jgi:glucokinase